MAQHDFVIDNGPGLAVRTDINAAILALATLSSGAVEPTTMYPGQLWLDTTVTPNGSLRMRNQANTAWVSAYGKAPTTSTHSASAMGASVASGATHYSVIGGGGGGSGGGHSGAGGGAGLCAAGGGGGAGGFGQTTVVALAGTTIYDVTIGAGAVGVSASTANGGNTIVTFGADTYTFNGGSGGLNTFVSGATTSKRGGIGGTVVNLAGAGGIGQASLQTNAVAVGGAGASSAWGVGGVALVATTTESTTGDNAAGYGAGGGSVNAFSSTNRAGGNGSAGRVQIIWYYGMS